MGHGAVGGTRYARSTATQSEELTAGAAAPWIAWRLSAVTDQQAPGPGDPEGLTVKVADIAAPSRRGQHGAADNGPARGTGVSARRPLYRRHRCRPAARGQTSLVHRHCRGVLRGPLRVAAPEPAAFSKAVRGRRVHTRRRHLGPRRRASPAPDEPARIAGAVLGLRAP